MRCVKCRGKAVIDLRRHNAGFCRDHFFEYFQNQVRRAIHDFAMFEPGDRILVAVSGGKDSLVLWDVLLDLGYQADGLYVDLGIGDYSVESTRKTEAFAASRGATLRKVSLAETYGLGVPELAASLRRPPCSGCGVGKRYIFNRVALEGGYDVVATGHNLDDEAATLLGNVLHWNVEYLARQYPVLQPTHANLVKKVKPLVRLTERETAAYAVLRGIDYIVEECPMAAGARSHVYKDLLNRLEHESPGSKHQFLFGFFERARDAVAAGEPVALNECRLCGQPTPGDVCAFCRMMQRAGVEPERLAGGVA